MKLIQSDKGYAWIILVSSSIVMFVGSSTYTSFGVLLVSTEIENSLIIWILNILFSLWFGTALIAGPLVTLYTHRKIVMFGFFMASIGLALSGVLIKNPEWLILSYSIVVGLGVGIGVHETLLLVLCHFRRLRGLAVGILSLSSLLGQILTPLIYDSLPEVKDKFYIRSLMTAVCFMASSFYIGPNLEAIDEFELMPSQPEAKALEIRKGNQINLLNDNKLFNNESTIQNIRNNTTREIKSTNFHIEINKIPSSQLPNIPEEREDLISACSTEAVRDSSISIASTQEPNEIIRPGMTNSQKMSMSEGHVGPIQQQSCKTTINPLDPQLVTKIEQAILHHNQPSNKKLIMSQKTNNVGIRHTTFRYRLDSIFDPEIEFMQRVREDGLMTPKERTTFLIEWKQALLHFDYNLLKNYKFVNVVIGCNLAILSLSIFPIILTSYIKNKDFALNSTDIGQNSSEAYTWRLTEVERIDGSQYLLNLIFLCDGVSRLGIGYMCDFSYVNKRVVFLIAMILGSCVSSSIRFISDIVMIKIFSGIYGCSIGAMASTEVLLLIDEFGMENLPSSYGLLLGTRVIFNFIISLIIYNPSFEFLYTIHPCSSINSNNITTYEFNSSDPLGLFKYEAWNPETERKLEIFFIWFGISTICGLLWIIEFLWIKHGKKLIARLRSSVSIEQINEIVGEFSYSYPNPGRQRSYSSPII